MTPVPADADGSGEVDFLAGVRILELGDGVAGASATSLLWSLGADVTTVIDASSPHRHGRPAVDHGGARLSLLALTLDRGKHLVDSGSAPDLASLIEDADVVVVDRVHGARGVLARLSDPGTYASFVAERNGAGWVTISASGLSGARAGDRASELTIAAASGMLGAVRDPSTGQPLKLAGQQSLLNTGQAAALAACHALDLVADGEPVHLDLSATEATLAMGPTLEVGGLLLNTGGFGGARRYGAPASFYECTDGLIRISAMEDHQWRGVVAALGSPAWAEDFATVESRIEGAGEIDRHVGEWTRTRSKEQAESTLQASGVPATAVYSPLDILRSPQLCHRGAFEPVPVGDGRTATVVGPPMRIVDGGNAVADAGQRRRRSLRGLKMLEASRVLAVPLCGAILGAIGVEVTKLEDLPRLDMYRRRGPYIDGVESSDSSAFFALMNHSKSSAAFDVDAHRDRLTALMESSDVVIENLGPKRAGTLGMAASTARKTNPDLLAVSSSGFGQDGPFATYRAYAYNLQAAGALGYLTRTAEGESAEIDIAWADLISAYALATVIAAWTVGPQGNAGVGVDFAMADLVISHFNEMLAAASLDPDYDADLDLANELAPYAPNGVYPTSEGWIAISVEDADQLRTLAEILDARALAHPDLDDPEIRFARRHQLDEVVAAATAAHPAHELAAALRARGVAAERVLLAADLVDDPQLVDRRFFVEVDHPQWSTRRLVGIPWRRAGGEALRLGAPPLLAPLGRDER